MTGTAPVSTTLGLSGLTAAITPSANTKKVLSKYREGT